MDFHFGSVNSQGSEHTMDGTASPMEIQLVFFNVEKFTDFQDAGQSSQVDALATISYMVEVITTVLGGPPVSTYRFWLSLNIKSCML